MKIRAYVEAYDFVEIARWARVDPGIELVRGQLSPTTFIAELTDTQMAGALSVLLTNAKYYCIPEGLYSNPDLTVRVRKEAMRSLCSYIEVFAKALEYKGLFCIPVSKAMERHFKGVGFKVAFDNLSTMYKAL